MRLRVAGLARLVAWQYLCRRHVRVHVSDGVLINILWLLLRLQFKNFITAT